jgi:hypothetical protein
MGIDPSPIRLTIHSMTKSKTKSRLIRPSAAKTAREVARIGEIERKIAGLEARLAAIESEPKQKSVTHFAQ